MIPSYRIEQWFIARQNKYMEQCDLVSTMTVNMICCLLYKYNLVDKESYQLENIIDECIDNVRQYNVYKNASDMRNMIEQILNKNFERKG